MQFIIEHLTVAQRAKVSAAKSHLEKKRSAIKAVFDQIDKLQRLIASLRSKREKESGKADRETEAAGNVLALDAQIKRLESQLQRLENSVYGELSVLSSLIGNIRQDVISAEFGNGLMRSLQDHIEEVMAPYFRERARGRSVSQHIDQHGMLMFLLQRRAPTLPDWPAADVEITNTSAELDRILAGQPLFDLTLAAAA